MYAMAQPGPFLLALAGLVASVACSAPAETGPAAGTATATGEAASRADHPYVGMWVTGDGHIRQELLPNGRYDEARGDRQSAYTGSYAVTGDRIVYRDDTGFSADGTFVSDDVLHHGGYVFHRRR